MSTNASNSADTDLRPDGAAPGDAAPEPQASPERFDFWRTAHRALRGRYPLALLLAAGGAVAGAGVGLMVGRPIYSATGLVRIASVLPQVLRETDQNKPMAMFDGFIQAQREVMTSRDVIVAAMAGDSWRSARTAGVSESQFAASLKVETRPRSDHLRVTFRNKEPLVAAAAVQSIIAAYQQAFTREQERVDGQRTGQLHARRASLVAELDQIGAAMGTDAGGHEVSEIEPLYAAAAERVKKLRNALTDVQCAIAGGPDVALRGGAPARLPSEIAEDEMLRSYAAEQARIDAQLAQARARFGPDHRTVLRLVAEANAIQELVSGHMERCVARRAATADGPAPMSLIDREANLRRLTHAAEEEMKQLAFQRVKLADLEARAATVRKNLVETDSRLDALATEASLGSRLTVISGGDRPMTALVDRRAKAASLGAIGGAAIPLGALICWATLRRRYRFGEEVAADLRGRVPLLAVLPEIDADAALVGAAARGVHDLRVRLQPPAPSTSRAYLITSVAHGEGKTSLTVALGLSFAAAGFRTLLVDADLDSRGLTRAFDADDSAGLTEASGGGEPSIRRVRGGLSLLAAGRCRPQDACRLAPRAAGRVLESVRDRFDVVLIDSGPILTGLAGAVLAPQVDGAVLALGRGQDPAALRGAAARIEGLGARLAAAVFNRAPASDFKDAVSAGVLPGAAPDRPIPERLTRFGVLAGAMLASLSLSREDDLDLLSDAVGLARSDEARRSAA